MKKVFLLVSLIIGAFHFSSFAQEQMASNKSQYHGLGLELWGTSTALNIHYLFLKKIKKNMFFQGDLITGYRYSKEENYGVIHVHNFSLTFNGGYLHKNGRSISLGWGLGQEGGRISPSKLSQSDKTNKSVLTFFCLNYSRRVSNERLILGVSLVYGIKIMQENNGLDPLYNKRILENKNWIMPGFSIGYCFGKKYFQKEKSVTE